MDHLTLPGPSNPKKIAKQPDLYKSKQKLPAAYDRSKEDLQKYSKSSYSRKKNVKNKKLASHLNHLSESHKKAAEAAYEHDHFLIPESNNGVLEPETELERTWKVTQDEIKDNLGQATAAKGFELDLDQFGPYTLNYTTNGRHLAIAGRKGHVATFDWVAGKLHNEMHLGETVRDIQWLHDQSFFAVAQKKYVYIYDHDGLEVHQLKNHVEVNKMEFLRYHFLLATVGNAGWLKYQDTSTGNVVAELRTKSGSCNVMAQNPYNGMIHLGHQNGTVTLWSPNTSEAQVKLLAHRGALKSVSIDPSSGGNYMATSGLDGKLKVWDMRKWETVNEWSTPKPAQSISYSQKGLLAVGWGSHATIYKDTTQAVPSHMQHPGPYMNNLIPGSALDSLAFCPFEDILGIGHANGFSSLIIPGAGEANFDSLEADPFESTKTRREREVTMLLDKLQPSLISQNPDFVGRIAPQDKSDQDGTLGGIIKAKPNKRPTTWSQLSRRERLSRMDQESGKDDQDQDGTDDEADDGVQDGPVKLRQSSKKARGRRKQLKKLRRREQHIVDHKTMQLREKLAERKAQKAKEKEASAASAEPQGALSRFSKFAPSRS